MKRRLPHSTRISGTTAHLGYSTERTASLLSGNTTSVATISLDTVRILLSMTAHEFIRALVGFDDSIDSRSF